ncbi:glycoside hydrolase [Parachaetomium inaequale]|uniref:Glycoside hydrolase n=1 Tax=Parachaetomium inaequale TaxID=2588326 RepID=A0AAN6PDC7_9PEZI|nr:glycoside hydrolase [Parachaetomium inaequale]
MKVFSRLWAVLCAVLFIGGANAAVQGVFAHYMVGGMSSISQALDDVSQAQSLGLDAFALNVQQPDAWWTRASLAFLFDAASQVGFKLFFSMDMAVIPSPSACSPLLAEYASHPAYYRYQDRPFLSTFRGGAAADANKQWQTVFEDLNPKPYFVPNFEDHSSAHAGVYSPSIFTAFPDVDGLMGWETAWPFQGTNETVTAPDQSPDAANLAVTRNKKMAYMMPLSTFQSKHLAQHGNWFRRGGLTLPQHMLQALSLQADFLEVLTWNDAGEGHYFGNLWPESIPDQDMGDLVDGWDHNGWRAVIGPFVAALKKEGVTGAEGVGPVGKEVAGAFWYRPLLKGVECGKDRLGLGKPDGWEDAEDMVYVVVMLGRETAGVKVRVVSGGKVVGEFEGKPGMNMYQVDARKGEQTVQVVAGDGKVLGEGKGKVGVTDRLEDVGGICTFNYQVVEIV